MSKYEIVRAEIIFSIVQHPYFLNKNPSALLFITSFLDKVPLGVGYI